MSIAESMRVAIENYAVELGQRTQILELAQRGELTPRAMALYLESLRYLFENTERHINLAAVRCEERGHQKLAQWFRNKAREERGHDRWPIADLAQLPPEAQRDVWPAPAVVALVELQARLVCSEPMCFVAYLQWAEYFSVHVGDAWLDALAMSGYKRSQVTAIHNHLETDRHHAAAGFREIDELASGRVDGALLLAAVEEAGRVFEALCNEICSEARRAA